MAGSPALPPLLSHAASPSSLPTIPLCKPPSRSPVKNVRAFPLSLFSRAAALPDLFSHVGVSFPCSPSAHPIPPYLPLTSLHAPAPSTPCGHLLAAFAICSGASPESDCRSHRRGRNDRRRSSYRHLFSSLPSLKPSPPFPGPHVVYEGQPWRHHRFHQALSSHSRPPIPTVAISPILSPIFHIRDAR